MNESIMSHDLHAMERQGMKDRIAELDAMFNNMHLDFAKCAKHNTSPCFFCKNDETCDGRPETCYFVWKKHN